jgi:hypothetical protein
MNRNRIFGLFSILTAAVLVLASCSSVIYANTFKVVSDGEVGAYFISKSATYENLLSITFGSNLLEITPTINNQTSTLGDYTSYGSRNAGDVVNFRNFITDTHNLWSSDPSKNYDKFDHMLAVPFTFQNGVTGLFVGFEDMAFGGDKDFDDILVLFMNISAVPEPETYAMLLLGLGLIGVFSRRT